MYRFGPAAVGLRFKKYLMQLQLPCRSVSRINSQVHLDNILKGHPSSVTDVPTHDLSQQVAHLQRLKRRLANPLVKVHGYA